MSLADDALAAEIEAAMEARCKHVWWLIEKATDGQLVLHASGGAQLFGQSTADSNLNHWPAWCQKCGALWSPGVVRSPSP